MIEQFVYKTIVRFSDTDLYGIAHHSNYFRWMEEARMQLLEEVLQLSLQDLEKEQIQFPVINLEGKFIKPVLARQLITVKMLLYYNNTSKLVFHYDVQNEKGEVMFHGKTEHVLIKNNKMLLKMPEFFDRLIQDKMKEYKEKFIVLCK